MDTSRPASRLLPLLASAALLLLIDTLLRTRGDVGLGAIPTWKLVALVGLLALLFHGTARLIRASGGGPRQRRALWMLALLIYGTAWYTGPAWICQRMWPANREAYLPLRLERNGLAGSVWWSTVSAQCGFYFNKEVLVFESDTRVRSYQYGTDGSAPLAALYLALDVWPYGEWTASGEVRDGVVTWRDERGNESRQRLYLEDGEITLIWVG